MRSLVLIAALAPLLVASSARSEAIPSAAFENPEGRRFVVTAQVLPWVAGIYSGGVEMRLNERFSLGLGAQTAALTFITEQNEVTSTTQVLGVGLQPGFSYFLVGKAPSGLWVGPKLELAYVALSTATRSASPTGSRFSTSTSGFTYGGHVMIGYNAIFANGLTLTGGLGLGATGFSFSTESNFGNGGGGGGGEPSDFTTNSAPTFLTASFGRVSLGAGWSF